jgi:hypothetical protein
MSWNVSPIRPPAGPPPKRALEPSPALARLLGSVGFTAVGLLTAKAGLWLFGLPGEPWEQESWDFKTVTVMVASVVFGFFGMVFGAGMGLALRVRGERAEYVFSAAWHFLANGSLTAFVVWSLVLVAILGTEGSKQFVRDYGPWRAAGASLGLSMAACLVIGVAFTAAGLITPRRGLRFLPSMVLVLPVTLPLAYGQFALLGLESSLWLVIGSVIPAAAILVSRPMMDNDYRLRQQARDNPAPT